MNNTTFLAYKGDVKVKLRIKDKIFTLDSHNSGLPALSRSFCSFITGNKITIEDIPEYLDLRVSNDEGMTWSSLLISKIKLTGKSWVYDSISGNYIAKFDAVISANNLARLIERSDSGDYRLYLYSGSLGKDSLGNNTGYYDMAYLDIEADALAYISPGTQAIIEWSMQLLNYLNE